MNRPLHSHRLLAAALSVLVGAPLLAPASLAAQNAPPEPLGPDVGDRVRIEWLDEEGTVHHSSGRLLGLAGGEIAIEGSNREVTVVPFERVESYQMRAGLSPAVGGVLGAFLGFGAASALAPGCSGLCFFDGKRAGIALAGGFVGTVVGFGLMNGQAWKEARLPDGAPLARPRPIVAVDRLQASASYSLRVGVRLPLFGQASHR